MIVHTCEQRSSEWFALRRGIITGSELGKFCLQPRTVNMTVAQICDVLSLRGIPHKKNAKRDDLLDLLPDQESYLEISTAAQELIDQKIGELEDGDDCPPSYDDYWMKRGRLLESSAFDAYAAHTGNEVEQVGLITHDVLPIGCSPDGLVSDRTFGLELKCPSGKIQYKRIREGVCPEEYVCQIHGSMVVTGAPYWDFFSWHPSISSFYIRVHRDDFTERLAKGLTEIAQELLAQKAWLENLKAA